MKLLKLIFIFFFSITYTVNANDFKFALGAEYLSNITKRGVTLYNSFQIIPIWSLDLGSPDWQIVGTSLNYRAKISENVIYRSRLSPSSTPDRPFFKTRSHEQPKERLRSRTGEWDHFLEFHIPELLETRLQYSQDISAHKGQYFELAARLILGNFLRKNEKPMLQPALFSSIGWGSSNHNSYFYGNEKNYSGFNNYSYGLLVASPGAIDAFYPTLQISRYSVTNSFKSGTKLYGKSSGTQIIALAAFRIF